MFISGRWLIQLDGVSKGGGKREDEDKDKDADADEKEEEKKKMKNIFFEKEVNQVKLIVYVCAYLNGHLSFMINWKAREWKSNRLTDEWWR